MLSREVMPGSSTLCPPRLGVLQYTNYNHDSTTSWGRVQGKSGREGGILAMRGRGRGIIGRVRNDRGEPKGSVELEEEE